MALLSGCAPRRSGNPKVNEVTKKGGGGDDNHNDDGRNGDGNSGTGGEGGTQTTTPNNSGSTTTTSVESLPTPGRGSTTGSSTEKCLDPGIADADQTLDYYKLKGIRGAGNGSSESQWSSSRLGESSATTGILVSDSRIHLRIMPRAAPGKGGRCGQQQTYTKLSLSISIRGPRSTGYLETLTFNEVELNECSKVLQFTVPNGVTSQAPFKLDIHDVLSDGTCRWLPGSEGCPNTLLPLPGDGPNGAGRTLRNGKKVNAPDACWKIDLHLATDDTKDIPR